MQKQFTFTRTDNLSEYQKLIYDMFEVWGHERFQLLTLLFQSVFTEEEMHRPEYVTSKLVALSQQGFASIRAAPSDSYQPAPIISPAPADTSTITEPETGSVAEDISIDLGPLNSFRTQITKTSFEKGDNRHDQ